MSTVQPILTTIGQAINDAASWAQALYYRIGFAFQALTNEFYVCIQFVLNPTNATAAYEKACILVLGRQSDPSDYSNPDPTKWITKDGVSADVRMRIQGGIKTGRGWAHYMEGGCDADSDGILNVVEIGGANEGPGQPLLDQINGKNLMLLVAGEEPEDPTAPPPTGEMTTVAIITGGTSHFFNGIIANRNAFVDQNNAPVYAVRDNDGSILASLNTAGAFDGKHLLRFVNTQGLNPSLITPPLLPREEFVWGDLSTGITYKAFNNGGAIILWKADGVVALPASK